MNSKRLKSLIKTAKDLTIKNGEHGTIILIEDNKGAMFVVKPIWENDEQKYKIINEVKEMLKNPRFKSYLFISESWFVSRKVGDPINVKASQQDDRQETLAITYVERTSKKKFLMLPFTRVIDEKGKSIITFDKDTEFRSDDPKVMISSIWDNLFNP